MHGIAVLVSLFQLQLQLQLLAAQEGDNILVDCGSLSNTSSTSEDGRVWQSEKQFLPPDSNSNTTTVVTYNSQGVAVSQKPPYNTARIFHSKFTYTFNNHLSAGGPKFIRFHFFNATTSTSFNAAESYFSVIANNYTLLTNFSPSLLVRPPDPILVREYIVPANDGQLNITLIPSPNSFAYLNGIEIVSMPDHLYYATQVVGPITSPIRQDTAFQTLIRLSVGGHDIAPIHDSMFRRWQQDDPYVQPQGSTSSTTYSVNYTLETPNYTAPEAVYQNARFLPSSTSTHNMTWSFSVDSGFWYLLRLHFCEFFLASKVVNVRDRIFMVFINNQKIDPYVDVISLGGGHPLMAVKRDYVVFVANDTDGRQTKKDLSLSVEPNAASRTLSTLLNGLEILKLSTTPDGSLSGVFTPNPESPMPPVPPGKNKGHTSRALILGIAGGVALLISLLVGFLIFFMRRKRADNSETDTKALWAPLPDKSTSTTTQGGGSVSSLPSDLCRHFSLEEIMSATGGFDDNLLIGVGGFGNVYKGFIDNGATEVAVKRLNTSSNQGAREFFTEIEMLSKLRHLHLVSLIGYCNDNGEMVLVYDYMSRGTLRDHLYKTQNPPLEWRRRLQICIGASKGLHYLHTGAKHTIIHRDVKSTNILVDDKWVAKVSDFGLSKTGPSTEETHVSTAVKGSFGYVDPEYYKRQQLTEKSDVYSFGVVLLEVLCARPAMLQSVPKEQVNLAAWALLCHRRNSLHKIVDPNLKGQIVAECLDKYVEIAFRCLKDSGTERPSMNDVVWGLEFALQLQDAAENKDSADNNNNNKVVNGEAITTDDDDMFSRSGDVQSSASKSSDNFTFSTSGGFKSETVFSEIQNPSAR